MNKLWNIQGKIFKTFNENFANKHHKMQETGKTPETSISDAWMCSSKLGYTFTQTRSQKVDDRKMRLRKKIFIIYLIDQ